MVELDYYQENIKDWTISCFGKDVASNKAERNYRFIEEALELVQACGCTKEECLQLVDYVYGRDKGEVEQEMGGAFITLLALCNAHELEMETIVDKSIEENWKKIKKIRHKWENKPKFGPLPQ